jgi:hypothetical protein
MGTCGNAVLGLPLAKGLQPETMVFVKTSAALGRLHRNSPARTCVPLVLPAGPSFKRRDPRGASDRRHQTSKVQLRYVNLTAGGFDT